MRDDQEGSIRIQIARPNITFTFAGSVGQDVYVLCTYALEPDVEAAPEHSFFRIISTLGFAEAVSRQIPGFIRGFEGHCTYKETSLLRKSDPMPMPPMVAGQPSEWMAEQHRYVVEQSIDGYFPVVAFNCRALARSPNSLAVAQPAAAVHPR
jgi:hypothetical protein